MRWIWDRNSGDGFRKIAVVLASVAVVLGFFALLAPVASAGSPGRGGLANAPVGQGAQPDRVNATCPADGQCFADVPAGNPFYANINRLYEQDIVSGYVCNLVPSEPCDAQNRPYFRWTNNVTRGQLAKFVDNARRMPGIVIDSNQPVQPIYVNTTAANVRAIEGRSDSAIGVLGFSNTNYGVYGGAQGDQPAIYGQATGNGNAVAGRAGGNLASGVYGENTGNGWGVSGYSLGNNGVYGRSGGNSAGVRGESSSTGAGVLGSSSEGHGVLGIAPAGSGRYAVYANGDLNVTGTCNGCALATYRIDHPAAPTDKYLNQAAVVSDELLNVYNGNVTLDARGEAVVSLPSWFEQVNKDYRYQLTAVGAAGPGLYVSQEIKGGSFKISGGTPGGKVSWQVTGVRHDKVAEANPLQVEQEKPAAEKGTYWNPSLYGQPDSKGVGASLKR